MKNCACFALGACAFLVGAFSPLRAEKVIVDEDVSHQVPPLISPSQAMRGPEGERRITFSVSEARALERVALTSRQAYQEALREYLMDQEELDEAEVKQARLSFLRANFDWRVEIAAAEMLARDARLGSSRVSSVESAEMIELDNLVASLRGEDPSEEVLRNLGAYRRVARALLLQEVSADQDEEEKAELPRRPSE